MKVDISLFDGDRGALRELFELADDSAVQLAQYMNQGLLFVARSEGVIVGHLQLIAEDAETLELKNMAVLPSFQGRDIGLQLINAAIEHCRQHKVRCLLVSTAAAGVGQLRFYQRAGFRMLRIERDAFTPATGYPEDIFIDGVLLRDRVWLSLDL